ncbi:STAS domain-containing protein [Halorhodospira halophila]|uniref:Anti-sigma-factor antagonist n=1 Tax=Halorhodospira halophila (strain DSM 244 / SL1) TaxID=349124 RepID=A1WYW8_HALHL|nr:STAS domain-containing protein [Halorhodospira halophila]ABM62880.1 anti-sigma-factor antagonist [Halorhodospira halophila SL1]MBK1727997.1 anti-sigma factor antagonist [Halorhodospira halophila]
MTRAALENGVDGRWRVTGRLELDTVGALWPQGTALFTAEGGVCEIDLAGVERTDSAGVALLIDWTRQARAHGGRLCLCHVPQQLLAIVHASGAEGVLEIADEPA